jgi:hypothetical protein
MDHNALRHSSIFTSLENLTWPEKGFMVVASETMLPRKIGFERS